MCRTRDLKNDQEDRFPTTCSTLSTLESPGRAGQCETGTPRERKGAISTSAARRSSHDRCASGARRFRFGAGRPRKINRLRASATRFVPVKRMALDNARPLHWRSHPPDPNDHAAPRYAPPIRLSARMRFEFDTRQHGARRARIRPRHPARPMVHGPQYGALGGGDVRVHAQGTRDLPSGEPHSQQSARGRAVHRRAQLRHRRRLVLGRPNDASLLCGAAKRPGAGRSSLATKARSANRATHAIDALRAEPGGIQRPGTS